MVKLLLLVTLVTMVLVVHGLKFNFQNFFINRLLPFPEAKNPPAGGRADVEAFVTQRVDNFDPTNVATWQQRYLWNGEYFRPGGCIFILLSGHWEVSADRFEDTMVHEMSREFGCYMFQLEHRYYGISRPTEDISNENLRFLNVQQALADIAHFTAHIRSESVTPDAQNSPIVLLGRHYGGSLAIWFRQSYPHLAIGVYASSSPTNSVVDHFQFKELSGAVYRHIGGNACYDRIARGFAALEQMVADGQNEELADLFQLCNELESTPDIQTFFALASEFYSVLFQFDQVPDVAGVCNIIANETVSDAEAISLIVVDYLDGECINIDYEQLVEEDRQTSWDAPTVLLGYRQRSYQACTQLGWYHSSGSRFQPYGSSFPVEFIYQSCEDVFGELFSRERLLENSARLNTEFGGLQPQATNVLYVHGQLDPWRTVGVQSDDNIESSTVIIIEGASQSNDIGAIADEDPVPIRQAKEQIRETIRGWLSTLQEVNKIPL